MRVGDVLSGQYEVVQKLGRGGMAEVWQCHDRQSDQKVAVKILRSDTIGDEDDDYRELAECRGRFRREAKLQSEIRHPGVPEIYHTGSHGQDPFIVMRFIDGVSLHEFLTTNTLTTAIVVSIAAQVADALLAVHALDVVHRDLKPHNILIDKQGRVVLIDFGIAMPLGPGATRYTRPGSTVGSVGYQAPEQILGDVVSQATDIYALGCVLYEMWAGRPPFTGERINHDHVKTEPVSLSCYNTSVPDDLDALTLRMLAKQAADRPSDVAEVLAVLQRHLPAVGDPDFSPSFDPDPSAVFRKPDSASLPSTGSPGVLDETQPMAVAGKRAHWLSRREVKATISEISAGPGDALASVLALYRTARGQWGPLDPVVRTVRLRAAEHVHRNGDHDAAAELYEEAANVAISCQEHQESANAYLGLAECRNTVQTAALALAALRSILELLPFLSPNDAQAAAYRAAFVARTLFDADVAEAHAILEALQAWLHDPS